MDWIIRQLDLQPHQHLLEVGCGSGLLLAAVASKLNNRLPCRLSNRTSLLYRQAHRRNKLLVQQEILQLHLGELHDLPYPNSLFSYHIWIRHPLTAWKNLATECLRLSTLLRSRRQADHGYHNPDTSERKKTSEQKPPGYRRPVSKSGLTDIHTEYQDFPTGAWRGRHWRLKPIQY